MTISLRVQAKKVGKESFKNKETESHERLHRNMIVLTLAIFMESIAWFQGRIMSCSNEGFRSSSSPFLLSYFVAFHSQVGVINVTVHASSTSWMLISSWEVYWSCRCYIFMTTSFLSPKGMSIMFVVYSKSELQETGKTKDRKPTFQQDKSI